MPLSQLSSYALLLAVLAMVPLAVHLAHLISKRGGGR
jgi:hypothetical protein